jgi:starch-binding outer membrane protein, SusD/RagB family
VLVFNNNNIRDMKKLLVLLSGILILTACEDFLLETPQDQLDVNQFFSDPSHAYNAVSILYRNGVPGFYGAGGAYSGSTMMIGGYMSGLFDNEYKGQEVHVQHAHNLTLSPINMANYLDNIWNNTYLAVSRANSAIKYIPDTPGLSDAEKVNLMAQARFFRALNYFHLVKTFGDVPLITEPYESLENLYVERTPLQSVYQQIVSDLEYIISESALNYTPMPSNNYRVSKAAAATLLADVYLTMSGYPLQNDNYANAASAARQVINSGNFNLIQHGATEAQSAYNVLRTSDNQSEYIYVVEFASGIAENGWLPAYSYPNRLAAFGLFQYDITVNVYRPLDEILQIYDPVNDLRIQEKQFFHSNLTRGGTTYNYEVSPYLWHDDVALFETMRGDKDQYIYRYAEVLLIAAEAIARSEGVTAEAIDYLVQVRNRGYWQTDESVLSAQLTGLSVDEFVREVWTERLREFPLEFKLWNDVQRTRLFPVTSAANPGQVNFVNVIGHTNAWGHTLQERHLLLPISENEMQRNPNLVQNPGY